jgi:hypothetical protein
LEVILSVPDYFSMLLESQAESPVRTQVSKVTHTVPLNSQMAKTRGIITLNSQRNKSQIDQGHKTALLLNRPRAQRDTQPSTEYLEVSPFFRKALLSKWGLIIHSALKMRHVRAPKLGKLPGAKLTVPSNL